MKTQEKRRRQQHRRNAKGEVMRNMPPRDGTGRISRAYDRLAKKIAAEEAASG